MTEGIQAHRGPEERAPDGRRVRWTEHRNQRRAAFVTAGAVAIDTYGPEASAEQMAEAAGVSRTVLYRYFRDREDLRQAVADEAVAAVVAGVLPKLVPSADSTPRQVISSVIEVVVDWLDQHPNMYYFLRDRRGGSALEEVENIVADQLAALLTKFLPFFGIDSEKVEPGAYGIVGFVESSGSWWLARRSVSREKLAEIVCDGVWYLLDGTARAADVVVGYDDPLPTEAFGQPRTDQEDG